MNRNEGGGEYFPRGHDITYPALSSKDMEERAQESSPLDLSFFYGGVGDSRHVFQQLHHIYTYSKDWRSKQKTLPADKFFFTVQDVKAHLMARNTILYRMLQDLSTIPNRIQGEKERQKEQVLLLSTIWYIFDHEIIPKYAKARLEDVIRTLINSGRCLYGNRFGSIPGEQKTKTNSENT